MVTLGGTVAIELQASLPVRGLMRKCALGSIGIITNSYDSRSIEIVGCAGAGFYGLFVVITDVG